MCSGINATGAYRKNDAECIKYLLDKAQRIVILNVRYTAYM
jgi:hypothetical protein